MSNDCFYSFDSPLFRLGYAFQLLCECGMENDRVRHTEGPGFKPRQVQVEKGKMLVQTCGGLLPFSADNIQLARAVATLNGSFAFTVTLPCKMQWAPPPSTCSCCWHF